jgi:hypothetical protein
VLLGVGGLLSAAAALAIGILLFGDFGETEGRILGSTALLAGYALLSLPAAMLQDQRRLPVLAAAVAVLAVAGATMSVVAVWTDAGDDLGRVIGTITALLVAAVQAAALSLRRAGRDPSSVRRLFFLSLVLVTALAAMVAVMLWAEIENERFLRTFGALVVLDLLAVALQPILVRARPKTAPYRLRVLLSPDGATELAVDARDEASAAAEAIRRAQRDGQRVSLVEFVEGPGRSQ